jgi:hypothetical protein
MESIQCPKVEWPVLIKIGESYIAGVTHSLSPNVAFIKCAKPLRLNEECDIAISVPNSDHSFNARVEVVWSNIYGPDDDITPRGMGVRFLDISNEDRRAMAKEASQDAEQKGMSTEQLQALQTLVIDESEIASMGGGHETIS